MTYLVVVAIGIAGMSAAGKFFQTTKYKLTTITSVCWAVAFVAFHSRFGNRLLMWAATLHRHEIHLYLSMLLVTLGSVGFIWLGLVVFWSGSKDKLGYPLQPASGFKLVAGLLIGTLFAAILEPMSWRHFASASLGSQLTIIGALVPFAVLEESVFRGRLLAELDRKFKRIGVSLVLQALIFLSIHTINLVRVGVTTHDPGIGIRGAEIIFTMGLLFGWLRHRSKGLWTPLGAHVAYNAMLVSGITA